MWQRNAVFVVLCLAGLGAVGGALLSPPSVAPPTDGGGALADDMRAVVDRVDRAFAERWAQLRLEPAPLADSLTLARRLSLGLTGTVPSVEELRALERLPESERVNWWLSHLVDDRRHADYLAERLARAYVGTDNGTFLLYRRRRFVLWLSDRLAENMPYDQLVQKLISDSGLWTDTPSVNFMTATLDGAEGNRPDPIRLAGRTTRAFLGMRIDCLQCHDDRLGNVELGSDESPRGGTQQDFHQLAAYFGHSRTSLFGILDQPDKGEYSYQFLRRDEEEVVPPEVPFLKELADSQGTRREALARWVTHPRNKPFARAIVNRMWAILCGRPLVEPIDDIPLHGPFPPGLEALADDLVAHGFDLRRLLRLIASTQAFQRDSRAPFEITLEHEDAWAAFPLTRLRPEQVAGAVIQSSSLTTIDAQSHIVAQLAKFAQQSEFIKRYGDLGEDEFEDRGGTISQRLLVMNGQLVRERTRGGLLQTAAAQIAALTDDDQAAVETAYLSTLSRRPTQMELEHFRQQLEGVQGNARRAKLEDLCWVLINSSEFCWNH